MQNNKKLSILIPTYNRDIYVEKNIKMLSSYIIKNKLENDIEIIVSNNNSLDLTKKILERLNEDIKFLKIYNQKENIGLEKNAIFTLEKSDSLYSMFLGDDDYIEENFLLHALEILEENKEVGLIIPNFYPISINGEKIGKSRDFKLKNQFYKKGFKSCLKNSWRGHQMSGIIFKTEKVYEEYEKCNVSNIYPFIYIVSYSLLNYKSYHMIDYPVKVTQIGQDKKDWNYGKDGLISEIFDNYKKLKNINIFQRFILEINILIKQNWRYLVYKKKFPIAVVEILKHKNTSILSKIIFPFVLIWVLFIKAIKKGFRLLCRV